MSELLKIERILSRLHKTTDAAAWAEEFMELVHSPNFVLDEQIMIGWFSEAMETARDLKE